MHFLHAPLALIASLSVASVSAVPAPTPTYSLVEHKNHVRAPPPVNDTVPVVVSGWYPAWNGDKIKPEAIQWGKYTSMTFAFATTTPNVSILGLDKVSMGVIEPFVAAAHNHSKKAFISIGGYTGSRYFSTAVGSPENRTKFVQTIVNFTKTYRFDGVDFDWEYPNGSGLSCNEVNANDSDNFLAFLQALKADPVGKNLSLTAAVGINPFNDAAKHPMKDVSKFAEVFDHIAIMAYDFFGPWSSTVGPNAPLDVCQGSTNLSSAAAVQAWSDAGFPKQKLTLGIASYGHSFHVNSSAYDSSGKLLTNATFDFIPKGDQWDGAPGEDVCGNQINHPGGIFNFWGLMEAGFLKADGTPAPGIDYVFDDCTKTPFVYNKTSGIMVSYDNKESFIEKGKYVNEQEMAGVTMWTVLGDSPNNILIDAIWEGMDVKEVCPN